MSAWHGIISAKCCPISAGRIELRAESQEDMPHAKVGTDEKVKKIQNMPFLSTLPNLCVSLFRPGCSWR